MKTFKTKTRRIKVDIGTITIHPISDNEIDYDRGLDFRQYASLPTLIKAVEHWKKLNKKKRKK